MLVKTTDFNFSGGDVRGLARTKSFGLHSILGCSSLTDALSVLGNAIDTANASGTIDSSDPNYAAATAFYANHVNDWTDFFDCATLLTQCKTVIDGLNQSLSAAGQPTVSTDTIQQSITQASKPLLDPGSLFPSWVLPVGIGLAVVIGVGVIFWSPIGQGFGRALFRKKKETPDG